MVERLTLPYLPILIGVKHLTIPNCPYCGKDLTLPNLGGAAYLADFTYIIIIAGTAANLARFACIVGRAAYHAKFTYMAGRAAYLATFRISLVVEQLTLPNLPILR